MVALNAIFVSTLDTIFKRKSEHKGLKKTMQTGCFIFPQTLKGLIWRKQTLSPKFLDKSFQNYFSQRALQISVSRRFLIQVVNR